MFLFIQNDVFFIDYPGKLSHYPDDYKNDCLVMRTFLGILVNFLTVPLNTLTILATTLIISEYTQFFLVIYLTLSDLSYHPGYYLDYPDHSDSFWLSC